MSARKAILVAMAGEPGRVVGLGHHPHISFYVKNLGDRPALLIDAPGRVVWPTSDARGFATMVKANDHRTQLLVRPQQASIDSPAFVSLVDHLFRATAAATSTDAAVASVPLAIEELRQFFGRNPTQLSEAAVRGLFAELLVVGRLVETLGSATAALRSWCGPYGGRDFQFADGSSAEVKSRHASAKSVRISSEFQLAPGEEPLWLLVQTLESTTDSDPQGLGFLELVRTVIDALRQDAEAHSLWDRAVIALGLEIADPYYDKYQFRALKTSSFLVNKKFPSLTPSDTPEGVSHVSYDLDLEAVSSFEEPIQTTFATIRESYE